MAAGSSGGDCFRCISNLLSKVGDELAWGRPLCIEKQAGDLCSSIESWPVAQPGPGSALLALLPSSNTVVRNA